MSRMLFTYEYLTALTVSSYKIGTIILRTLLAHQTPAFIRNEGEDRE
jgi:hypothetical protein